ncbi:unnamed protein product, partial [Urochloa humidicola]
HPIPPRPFHLPPMAAGEADAAAAARCPSPRRLPCLAGPLSAPSSPPHHAQRRRRAPLLTTHNGGGVLGGGDGSGQSEAAASAPHPAAPLTALGAAGPLASLTGSGHRQPRPSSRRGAFGRRARPAVAARWVARAVGGPCRHGRRLGRQAARARARRAAEPERRAPAPIHNVRGAWVKRRRPFTAPSREGTRDGGAARGAWRRAAEPVRPRRRPGMEALARQR